MAQYLPEWIVGFSKSDPPDERYVYHRADGLYAKCGHGSWRAIAHHPAASYHACTICGIRKVIQVGIGVVCKECGETLVEIHISTGLPKTLLSDDAAEVVCRNIHCPGKSKPGMMVYKLLDIP